MAKKFKRMTDEYDSITIPDFLVSHFKSTTHTIRIVAATALSLFVIIYVSAQIDITGKTFESFLGLDYYTGIAIASMITGFLCIPFFKFVVPNISTLEPYINKLDVMLPSVLLALFAGWAVSTFYKD